MTEIVADLNFNPVLFDTMPLNIKHYLEEIGINYDDQGNAVVLFAQAQLDHFQDMMAALNFYGEE